MVGNILAVGLMSLGMGMSGVKDEPKQVVQTQESITLTNYTYSELLYLAQQYIPEITEASSPSTDMTYTVTDLVGTGSSQAIDRIIIKWQNPHSYTNNAVTFEGKMGPEAQSTKGQFTLNLQTQQKTVNEGNEIILTTYPEEWTYYLKEEQPPRPMGNSIISEIASGLGLIGALATEFLAGFGALFYVQGALTPFAIFSLVFLGIAVSFAVIKIVLSLIRSNTGA